MRKKSEDQAQQIKELRRAAKRAKRQRDIASPAVEIVEEITDGPVDMDSLLSDMNSALVQDASNVSEVEDILQSQREAIERIRKMRERMDQKKAPDNDGALKQELEALRKQNKQSDVVIDKLNSALQNNRLRLQSLTKEIPRLRANSGKLDDAEITNRRLHADKKAAEQKLVREMGKHQLTVERIREQLQASEKKNRAYIEERTARETSLLSTIRELQEKLKEASSSGENDELIGQLQVQLDEAQSALDRAVREKEFMESHFVELEKALEESTLAQDELERTKKEYQMLEEHFMAMLEDDTPKDVIPDGAEEDPDLIDLIDVAGAKKAAEDTADYSMDEIQLMEEDDSDSDPDSSLEKNNQN